MVSDNVTICPICGGRLYYYSTTKRIIKYGGGIKSQVYISRLHCKTCGREHRALPSYILPYKHYDADIIRGFRLGKYSTDEIAFENYPSESTVRRWQNEKSI
jgi:transcription elongation factor Elf1